MKEKIIFILLYQWKYIIAILRAKGMNMKVSNKTEKLIYVAREADRDWIFGAIVTRLAKYSSLNASTYFHPKLRNLPETDGYFFVFPHYFLRAVRHNPQILKKKNIVMYTHENFTSSYSKTHIVWCLKLADKIICLNSEVKKKLISYGIKEDKLEILHIASDPDFFYPHERNNGDIGFCSNFGERKNPELTYQIIKNMPEKKFHIIGRNWENFDKFKELYALENFTYHNNRDYSEYPDLYNKIDVFISPSTLEGGPVPVLEAMLSNCVPVASKTGFCPDIINHGENGFLFDINADYKQVISLIRQAFELKTNIRKSALPYSWENCSKKLDDLFKNI